MKILVIVTLFTFQKKIIKISVEIQIHFTLRSNSKSITEGGGIRLPYPPPPVNTPLLRRKIKVDI